MRSINMYPYGKPAPRCQRPSANSAPAGCSPEAPGAKKPGQRSDAALPPTRQAHDPRPGKGEPEFKALYKELIEDQHHAVGWLVHESSRADQGAADGGRLSRERSPPHPAAGAQAGRQFDRPCCRGPTPTNQKALLLLAHIDVVEADLRLPTGCTRSSFKLRPREDGFYYARGSSDDKSMAAIFADTMVRFKKSGYKPKRAVKMALTCGEESPNNFDGASYLVEHYKPLLDAAFALNEGAGGRLDPKTNKYVFNGVQAGEEGLSGLHAGSDQSRRALLAADAEQRDLPSLGGAVEGAGDRLSSGVQRRDARLFCPHGRAAGRAGGRRHGGGVEGATERPSRSRRLKKRPQRQLDPAHQLCGDAAVGRARAQRPAPARHRQHQLPHLPGSRAGGNPQGHRKRGRRSRRERSRCAIRRKRRCRRRRR